MLIFVQTKLKTMLITFAPTGENVEVGQSAATPQALGTIASNPIYIDVPAGYTPIQGSLEAGSSSAWPILGSAKNHYIGFFAGQSKTLMVTKFKMDDAAAVTTGLASIATALAAGDLAVTLNSDGTTGV